VTGFNAIFQFVTPSVIILFIIALEVICGCCPESVFQV